jgi:hypothetical protein
MDVTTAFVAYTVSALVSSGRARRFDLIYFVTVDHCT